MNTSSGLRHSVAPLIRYIHRADTLHMYNAATDKWNYIVKICLKNLLYILQCSCSLQAIDNCLIYFWTSGLKFWRYSEQFYIEMYGNCYHCHCKSSRIVKMLGASKNTACYVVYKSPSYIWESNIDVKTLNIVTFTLKHSRQPRQCCI